MKIMLSLIRTLLVSATLMFAAVNSATAESELDDEKKKFSYAIGLQIAQSLVRQGVNVDADAFSLAVRDALAGEQPRLSPQEMEKVLKSKEKQASGNLLERAKENLKRGREFLAKNKEREEVQVMESGLQFWIIREGQGGRPKPGDTVSVHYTGTLIDGREFDSSHRRGEPAILGLDGVIKGWAEALQLMQIGAKWQIYVPPALAYGVRGAGSAIGPNETLIFDIELLDIVR